MALDTPVVVGSVAISGVDYPIYGTHARSLEYHRGSLLGSTFTGAAFTTQLQALVTARRWLDRQAYIGAKAGGDTQFTQFPRDSDTTVPLGVEFAEYELALVLISKPTSFNQRSTGSNRKRLKAGSTEIEFFSRTDGNGGLTGEGVFPPQALDLLGPYLASRVSIITPTVGGLSNVSNVLPVNEFGLVEPL